MRKSLQMFSPEQSVEWMSAYCFLKSSSCFWAIWWTGCENWIFIPLKIFFFFSFLLQSCLQWWSAQAQGSCPGAEPKPLPTETANHILRKRAATKSTLMVDAYLLKFVFPSLPKMLWFVSIFFKGDPTEFTDTEASFQLLQSFRAPLSAPSSSIFPPSSSFSSLLPTCSFLPLFPLFICQQHVFLKLSLIWKVSFFLSSVVVAVLLQLSSHTCSQSSFAPCFSISFFSLLPTPSHLLCLLLALVQHLLLSVCHQLPSLAPSVQIPFSGGGGNGANETIEMLFLTNNLMIKSASKSCHAGIGSAQEWFDHV